MTDKKDIYSENWYMEEICNDFHINRASDGAGIGKACNGDDEGWKRANLMAAAPEMFRSLEALLDAIRGYFGWDGGGICGQDDPVAYFIGEYRAAETAIRKARGESND